MKTEQILNEIGFDEFISFDLETTGLNPNKNEIIEISAVKFKKGLYHSEFSTLVKPETAIPKHISKITGITNSMVSNSPNIKEVLPTFIEFVNNGNLIAHNIDFDLGFIKKYIQKYDKQINFNSTTDTLSLSRSFLFNLEKFNLEYLSMHFQLNHDNAHRATPDAINTGKIFIYIVKKMISMPKNIFKNINQICLDRKIHNTTLYSKIYQFLNHNELYDKFDKKDFNLKNNVIKNINGNNKSLEVSINSWFKQDGILSKAWKNYSYREVQDLFSNDVYNNFLSESKLVSEAGAGLGKSLGYLIASVKYAIDNNKKIIISTYTKTLQEQLFYKDIPLLINELNLNIKGIILKGKNNYISKIKLNKIILKDHIYMNDKDINECITLIVWSHFTSTGDVEECNGLSRQNLGSLWSKLSFSDYDNSSINEFFLNDGNQNDFYHKIVNEITDSDIIVVNHSLLCTDMTASKSILPNDSILIIDEGHNFINAMRNTLTLNVSDNGFIKLIKSVQTITNSIKTENFLQLNITVNKIIKDASIMFEYFKSNFEDVYDNLNFGQFDQMMTLRDFKSNGLDTEILLNDLIKLLSEIDSILKTNQKKFFFLHLIRTQILDLCSILKVFNKKDLSIVRWVSFSKNSHNHYFKIHLLDGDYKKFLKESLFNNYKSFLMCSATFTINDSFDYFFSKLPMKCDENIDINTNIYKSPFFYEEQSKYYIFNKSMDINSSEYINEISSQVSKINQSLSKRVLVLCTSYKQVNAISQSLLNSYGVNKNDVLIQTSKFSKKKLLDRYKSSKSSILVATSTFWEGVDLPGELLEILFIVRIPFGNPSNPYNSHFCDLIESQGGNSFYDMQLPDSILKLKQGVGRLIRTDRDSGVCILTDPRLSNARYGKYIIDELTPNPDFYSHFDEIINDIDNFLG